MNDIELYPPGTIVYIDPSSMFYRLQGWDPRTKSPLQGTISSVDIHEPDNYPYWVQWEDGDSNDYNHHDLMVPRNNRINTQFLHYK